MALSLIRGLKSIMNIRTNPNQKIGLLLGDYSFRNISQNEYQGFHLILLTILMISGLNSLGNERYVSGYSCASWAFDQWN